MAETNLLSNRYRILTPLGSGGFGTTYLAEDTFLPSGRRCVIKQLKTLDHSPKILTLIQERFQREAAVLEELGESCRQIPRLYAYFNEGDQFYLVQEWIDGETLSQVVARHGALSQEWVILFLSSMLQVLDIVHRKRIIHRDIKPDNIMLRRSDSLPILIDFGAIKESVVTTLASPGSPRTITIGTPGFMPSDQAVGRPVYSSDLYALGLTALFALTGRLPEGLPINPTTGRVYWSQLGVPISPRLTTVLDKATELHPRDRFSTAREMFDALPRSSHTTNLSNSSDPIGLAGATVPIIPPTVANTTQRGVSVPGVPSQGQVPTRRIAGAVTRQPSGVRSEASSWTLLISLSSVALVIGSLGVGYWLWGRPRPSAVATSLPGSPAVAPSSELKPSPTAPPPPQPSPTALPTPLVPSTLTPTVTPTLPPPASVTPVSPPLAMAPTPLPAPSVPQNTPLQPNANGPTIFAGSNGSTTVWTDSVEILCERQAPLPIFYKAQVNGANTVGAMVFLSAPNLCGSDFQGQFVESYGNRQVCRGFVRYQQLSQNSVKISWSLDGGVLQQTCPYAGEVRDIMAQRLSHQPIGPQGELNRLIPVLMGAQKGNPPQLPQLP